MVRLEPMTDALWGETKHFKPYEFGPWAPKMARNLIAAMDTLRELVGVPLRVTSSGRTQAYQDELVARRLSTNRNSYHVPSPDDGTVQGVDLSPDVPESLRPEILNKLWANATGMDLFRGVGIYPWGIHLDVGTGWGQRRPHTWAKTPQGFVGNPDPEVVWWTVGLGQKPREFGGPGNHEIGIRLAALVIAIAAGVVLAVYS